MESRSFLIWTIYSLCDYIKHFWNLQPSKTWQKNSWEEDRIQNHAREYPSFNWLNINDFIRMIPVISSFQLHHFYIVLSR